MGNKRTHKLVAVIVALTMIFTSGISVFAASSPTAGKVSSVSTAGAQNGKSITITWKKSGNADKYVVTIKDVNTGKTTTKTVTKGTSLKVTTTAGHRYKYTITPYYKNKKGTAKSSDGRWMKTTKITDVTSGKKKVTLKWNKVSGATKYKVLQYKSGKWTVVTTVKSTKATISVKKAGTYKFKVVPYKGSYRGVRSVAKAGKAK